MEHWLRLQYENALPTYRTYRALQLHFGKGTYNYFRYGGNVKATVDTLVKAKGSQHYIQLHKRIENAKMEPFDFICANFLAHGVKWVGALCNENATKTALKFRAMLEDIGGHTIKQLNNTLMDRCIDDDVRFKTLVEVDNPLVLPGVVDAYVQQDIDFHAMLCLSNCLGLKEKYDKELAGNFIWEDLSDKIANEGAFYRYDTKAAKMKLAAYLKEYW